MMRPAPLLIWMALLAAVALPAASTAEPPAPPPSTLTLAECYALALKRSETIAMQRELISEADARFLQAFSGALPRASFIASEKRQDGSGSSAFTLSEVPERKFNATYTLFAGFKEFAAMKGARAEHRQRTQEKARAEQLLLTDVANAFYLLREQREDLGALEGTRIALLQRLEDLSERERLGRSRESEVASAVAKLRRIEAETERVRGLETTARQLLEFLTDVSRIEAVADADAPMSPMEPLEAYLGKAPSRPDVRAAEEALTIAKQQVTINRAGFWPTLDVEGNYYTKRVGAAADVDWDVLALVEVPLFQGGQVVGEVREASAKARSAAWELSRVRRAAELDIRDTYAEAASALDRAEALAHALDAAEDNYRLQAEDYRRNLVNNLDVLDALQDLQDARRDALHATYESKRLYWQLRTAVGETL